MIIIIIVIIVKFFNNQLNRTQLGTNWQDKNNVMLQ